MRILLTCLLLTVACTPTKSERLTCTTNKDCIAGSRCDLTKKVCVCDGTTTIAGCEKFLDAAVEAVSRADMGILLDVAGTGKDVLQETGEPPDAGFADGSLADGAGVDVSVPDAAGSCGVHADCVDPAKAFCVAATCGGCQAAGANACGALVCDGVSGKCVECTSEGQCTKDPTKAFCLANVCTGCTAGSCTGPKTVCAPTGQCVECTADAQCTKDPLKTFCVTNVCSGCNKSLCTGTKPVCAATGTSAGLCVECAVNADCTAAGKKVCDTNANVCVPCLTNADCGFDPTKPICQANQCVGCGTSGVATGACASKSPGAPVCDGATGKCVECTASSQCTTVTKPICGTGQTCVGCGDTTAVSGSCSAKNASLPACKTATGACVECVANGDCTAMTGKKTCNTSTNLCVPCVTSTDCTYEAAKPICTSNACGACTADSQCVTRNGANPGICMNHLDGRCATDAETIYVENKSGCSDTGAGTAAVPFCTVQKGVNSAAASSSKALIVATGNLTPGAAGISPSTPLTIAGKSAVITPEVGAVGIGLDGGVLYLRNVKVQGTASSGSETNPGIRAAVSGSTLHMRNCTVTNNQGGGILLNGAAFDIENTTVTGNGTGLINGNTWGGVRIEALPSSGPIRLDLVTIKDNKATGLYCPNTIQGSGVLATNNTTLNITPACNITACTTPSAICGAQP